MRGRNDEWMESRRTEKANMRPNAGYHLGIEEKTPDVKPYSCGIEGKESKL